MNMTYKQQLSLIIHKDQETLIKRESSLFDELTYPLNTKLVLFGAGGLGRKVLRGLRSIGIEPIAFADNSESLWGTIIDGVYVLRPEEAALRYGKRAAFVVTIWRAGDSHRFENTRKQLRELQCLKVVSFAALFWKYADIFLPYYAIGSPHVLAQQAELIERVADFWHDDASRAEYLAQLRFRFQLDFDNLSSPVKQDQYFPDDLFRFKNNEIFIDCGAFDGDTIKVLLEKHHQSYNGKIIALEPDPDNLIKLRSYVDNLPPDLRNKIKIVPKAVGAHCGTVCFSATGTAAAVVDQAGSSYVDCITLDEILQNVNPTVIKMDIEGAEPEALEGAKNIIQQAKPILAISVYHYPDHLWQIPLIINTLFPDYHYFLRPHNEEGWDLVCYAIPAKRLALANH